MTGVLASLVAYLVGGAIAALAGRNARVAGLVGAGACVVAAVMGLPEVVAVLAGEPGWVAEVPWQTVPGATVLLGPDRYDARRRIPAPEPLILDSVRGPQAATLNHRLLCI